MKAILWRDWRIFRTSPFCWGTFALFLTTMLLMVAFLTSTPGGGNDAGISDGLIFAIICAPMTGWSATYSTLHTMDANRSMFSEPSNAAGGEHAGDGTMELFRCSGRPMLTYCLAKSLLPMAVAETMTLMFMAYLAWCGLMTAHGTMPIPDVLFTLVAPLSTAFALEEMLLVIGGGALGMTAGMLVSPVLLTGFVGLCLSLPLGWAPALAVVFGLAMAALTVALARRRYPDTLRPVRE